MSDSARYVPVLVGAVALIAIVAAITLLPTSALKSPETASSASRLLQSELYTVTLYNDTSKDADFEAFVWGDYTDTLTTIGEVKAETSTTFTVPAGGDQYVFYLETEVDGKTAYLDASVTGDRLVELDYYFRFFEDDMGLGALDASDWPTVVASPEIITDPTSTVPPTP